MFSNKLDHHHNSHEKTSSSPSWLGQLCLTGHLHVQPTYQHIIVIIITVMITKPHHHHHHHYQKPHHHDDQGNCVCLAIYTPNPRQPSNNPTASHQASLVRVLKFVPVTTITSNYTIAWESWGHVICFMPIILSIEYRLIYALFPCTQICFPELQSFQKKKCY